MSPYRLRDIVRRLRAGAIIAYPTEAVFGLGCDPCNEVAVRRLLTVKGRPAEKGLILIASCCAQLEPFLEPLSSAQRSQLHATWPGPATWLIPARAWVPTWLRGRYDTLAVRVTAHGLAAKLCQAWGAPLVSTSANLSGCPPARNALAVRRHLGALVDVVVPGTVGSARNPTEIRDLRNGAVVRAG